MLENFYHAHHMFTQDYWILSVNTEELKLGLDHRPFVLQEGLSLDLGALGLTLLDIKHRILTALLELQETCYYNSCKRYPQLLCRMHEDRLEHVEYEGVWEWYDRFRLALCSPWTFETGDPIAGFVFHAPTFAQEHNKLVPMHALAYGLVVETTQPLPHSMMSSLVTFA